MKLLRWSEFGWKSFFRKRKIWIAVIVLILIAGGGYAAYHFYFQSPTQANTTQRLQTAVARRGDLTVFATGAGQVIAATEISIGFDESGTLSELLVKLGDKVQAGQVLARLQTDQTQADIALALAEAQQNVISAQQVLDDIYNTADQDAAQALKDVEDAQNSLDDLQNSSLTQAQALQAVTQAQDAVDEAQRAYNNAHSTADQKVIDEYNAQLVLAESKLKDAQEKYNTVARKEDPLQTANQQLKLSQAQSAYDSARRNYDSVTSTASQMQQELAAADLATARAKLADAQREYERLKDGPTAGDLALAKANLAAAQTKYDTLKNGPDPAEIELAKANLASAQAKLAVAQEDKAVKDLLAPSNGTILSIDANVGEKVGTSAIISMADLSQPMLQVYMDETDLDKVVVGYEADVVFDSLPDSTFTGHVMEVSPSLERVSNVDAVAVKVQLDAASFAKPLSLPVGSNATVDVIGGRAQNAVLIPVEALREIAPNEYAVFVMQNGDLKLRTVTVGLMDYTSAEITSGLQAGEVVTTGVVQTNSNSGS